MPQAELEDQVQISSSFEDLCDQNVIVYLLRTKASDYMPKVRRDQVSLIQVGNDPGFLNYLRRPAAASVCAKVLQSMAHCSTAEGDEKTSLLACRHCWRTAATA